MCELDFNVCFYKKNNEGPVLQIEADLPIKTASVCWEIPFHDISHFMTPYFVSAVFSCKCQHIQWLCNLISLLMSFFVQRVRYILLDYLTNQHCGQFFLGSLWSISLPIK
jgi:hypothetical protein